MAVPNTPRILRVKIPRLVRVSSIIVRPVLEMKGPKRGSGQRSNLYSESKYSNWSPFDPFESEINALPAKMPPADSVHRGEALDPVPIYVRDVHAEFVRPCEPAEVKATLEDVPRQFLTGLKSVCLLAGTTKQSKVSAGRLFRYGCYGRGEIYLHAFPRRLLSEVWPHHPKPSILQEYRRAGAQFTRTESGWKLQFTMDALRRFFLFDVLLHELGHHVEYVSGKTNDRKSAERFANWFAQYAARLRTRGTGTCFEGTQGG